MVCRPASVKRTSRDLGNSQTSPDCRRNFYRQGNFLKGLCSSRLKMGTALHRLPEPSTFVLNEIGLNKSHIPLSFSTVPYSQGCVLASSSHCGNGRRSEHSKDRGRGPRSFRLPGPTQFPGQAGVFHDLPQQQKETCCLLAIGVLRDCFIKVPRPKLAGHQPMLNRMHNQTQKKEAWTHRHLFIFIYRRRE